MKLIQQKAEEVQVVGSIITIIMVIGVLVNCIRLYQECNKEPKDLKNELRRLSLREKRLLRREMKKQLGDKYDEYKDDLEAAILEMAGNLSEEEITTMLAEVD